MSQKYGQHFLIDEDILAHIAETVSQTAQKLWSDRMIEIWPWEGVLTSLIIDEFDHVTLYEIDERMRAKLYPIISGHQDASIVWWDVLDSSSLIREVASMTKSEDDGRFVESSPVSSTLVVWNLPYYITSPILRKFFEPKVADTNPACSDDGTASSTHIYPWGVFLVQKEVAQKISTDAKKKSFLRWILNYRYDVEYIFTVPPTAFNPPPKVDSAVFTLIQNPEKADRSIATYIKMMNFLDAVSGLKRKTLGKIRKMRAEFLEWFVLPDDLKSKRLEELEWEDMWSILWEAWLVN